MGMKRKKKAARGGRGAQAFAQLAVDSMQGSRDRKAQGRRRMRVAQLQRAADRQLRELRAFPVAPPAPRPAPRRGPTPPEQWKLKGAARPAALLARIAAGELDECGDEIPKPVETFDLFAQMERQGRLGERPETREYLRTLRQLAQACCDAGMPDRGIQNYERCMQLDPADVVRSREGLVCALIDDGRGAEARELLDKYTGETSAVLAYCRVILEYVSWEVLEEDGSSEEVVQGVFKKAFALNPFVAVFLAAHETFAEVVEYVEDIKEPKPGSIEEAFVYCCNNIGVWVDTVGAAAWIDKELDDVEPPVPTEEHASDKMYLGMYQTAVEMHKERIEEELAANDSDDSDAVDLDEHEDFEPDDIDGGDD